MRRQGFNRAGKSEDHADFDFVTVCKRGPCAKRQSSGSGKQFLHGTLSLSTIFLRSNVKIWAKKASDIEASTPDRLILAPGTPPRKQITLQDDATMILRVLALLIVPFLPASAVAMDTSTGTVTLQKVADGLDSPWAFGFLPDGSVLVTEQGGTLKRIAQGQVAVVSGVGQVRDSGQGGFLDILVPRDFGINRHLFFTLSHSQGLRAGTAVARATLSDDAQQLLDWRIIYEMDPGSSGGRHFGSRLVEARDGTLFVTVGDRGDRPSAQDLGVENGSVLRITKDGNVPADNPFVGQPGVQPEIWSFGHRNPQGAASGLDGQLWVAEHGARGGDEVNLVQKGANYGWPVISYGVHYSGWKIGEGTEKDGMEQPQFYWDPSMAPSGMMIYSGALWPQWRGHIFVGSLKFDYISRLSGTPLSEVEQLASDETLRVRDVREGPEGGIWFLSVGNGALYRMTP
jgi:glucose/arabinose dehydrogenase